MIVHATAVVHINLRNPRNPRNPRESNPRHPFHEPLPLMIQIVGFGLAHCAGRDAPSNMYGNEN
jgi:hypothetical protein